MALQSRRGSVLGPAIWMVVLSLLLFWLPVIGPLIAGFVGGRKAGTVRRAMLAATLPALAIAAIILLISTLGGLPFVGLAGGAAFIVGFVLGGIPLYIGALIGAVMEGMSTLP